jgi:hypothetical protein
MVNGPARNVDEFLIALDEQGDQQSPHPWARTTIIIIKA